MIVLIQNPYPYPSPIRIIMGHNDDWMSYRVVEELHLLDQIIESSNYFLVLFIGLGSLKGTFIRDTVACFGI